MPEAVTILVFDRKTGSRKHLTLKVNDSEKIEKLVKNVENLTNIPSGELEVIFCGKRVNKDKIFRDLSIGPTTELTFLRPNKSKQPTTAAREQLTQSSIDSDIISSFFVFCKNCDTVKKGKLRVYCRNCASNAVLVKSEPHNWSDVLKSKRIRVQCENCQDVDTYADFKFKCADCSEISPVLTHARGNWQLAECCICDSQEKVIIDLGCNHPTCQECFKQYLEHALSSFNFINKPPHGYTISCPFPNCNRVVQDVHHFYLMGRENYKEYQKRATEKLVTLDDEGVICPNPKCGQCFYWEPYDDDSRLQCPDCLYSFCRKCNENTCICLDEEDLTKTTIEATTRKCPKCNVPTERNGGCAHIHCTSCGLDWCFKCVSEWTEECQWDHWF